MKIKDIDKLIFKLKEQNLLDKLVCEVYDLNIHNTVVDFKINKKNFFINIYTKTSRNEFIINNFKFLNNKYCINKKYNNNIYINNIYINRCYVDYLNNKKTNKIVLFASLFKTISEKEIIDILNIIISDNNLRTNIISIINSIL